MVNIRKADGTTQPFDREKVLRTCRRLGLSQAESEDVLGEISQRIFEGMPTRSIMDMIFEHGRKHREHFAHIIDIREALSLMRPKPDFEQFVSLILQHEGYETKTNMVIQGGCIEHEIDVIGMKGNETIFVEVKHHMQFHTFTGLDVFLQVNSSVEDLMKGYLAGRHAFNFTRPVVVLNTKISDHAKKYAACRGIGAIAWGIPEHAGLEKHIDQKQLFPITVIKGLQPDVQGMLGDAGVYTLKQLVEADAASLAQRSGVNPGALNELAVKARSILGGKV